MRENSYVLAVDIGTSRVAAAIARAERGGDIRVTPFALGRRGDCVATVVFISDDGDLLFGDAAERRGVTQPERLVREFKRSIGDDVPLVIGGRSVSPETLYAETFAAIVDTVTERMGARPDAISLTHPTKWGAHRLGLIRTALGRLGIDDVSMISEPEAAARQYEATRPLEAGQSIAVYDLGGGTFDAVVLHRGADSELTPAGDPAGLDDLGGANFDDSVLRHVISASGLDVSVLSVDDPDTRLALSQLRREAVDAKEALSFDSDVTIPVLIPPIRSSVRLTRSEFEDMIDEALETTLGVLENAIDSADLTADQLEAILLIGGSSRIPLVAQRLSERFDRPLAVDADPKASIALGAARTAFGQLSSVAAAPVALTSLDAAIEEPDAGTEEELSSSSGFLARFASAFSLVRRRPSNQVATHRSPWLMAGAVALISGAIIFGGTMAAGSRMTVYDSDTSADADSSGRSEARPSPTTDPATKALDPFAKVLLPLAPIVDSGLFERDDDTSDARRTAPRLDTTDEPSASPRSGGPQAAPPDSPAQSSDVAPPAEDTSQPSDTSTPPTTDPPTSDPPTEEPTTDPPAPDPAPDPPTTDPVPDPPTTEPAPPAPEPTTDPA